METEGRTDGHEEICLKNLKNAELSRRKMKSFHSADILHCT